MMSWAGRKESRGGGGCFNPSLPLSPLPQNMLHPQELMSLVGGMQVQDWSAMKTVSAGWCG